MRPTGRGVPPARKGVCSAWIVAGFCGVSGVLGVNLNGESEHTTTSECQYGSCHMVLSNSSPDRTGLCGSRAHGHGWAEPAFAAGSVGRRVAPSLTDRV